MYDVHLFCHLCHLSTPLCFSVYPFPTLQLPLPIHLYTACSTMSMIRWTPLLLASLHRHLSQPFRSPWEHSSRFSRFWWPGLMRPCRCRCSPIQWFVRHRRSKEPGVQQSLKHQRLDCGPCSQICLSRWRTPPVIALLHVFGSISFTDVADQCFMC